MKSDFKAKTESVGAAVHNRPRWMTSRKTHGDKDCEMVHLTAQSNLGRIPAELQLHILSYLDFREVARFKQTCRYFNYFINEDILKESKSSHIAWFHEMEETQTLPPNMLPCYTCLMMRPEADFYSEIGNYYYNLPPHRAGHPVLDIDYKARYCIPCGFDDCKFKLGLRLTTGGRSMMYCSGCGKLDDQPVSLTPYIDVCCEPCKKEFQFLRENGVGIRMVQWILAVIILSLACTGKAMPWTSKADQHSLRWIFTVLVCMLTIAGGLISFCSRSQISEFSAFRTRRSENGRFVFLVESSSMLAWMGVAASLFNEGAHRGFGGRYDKFAKALTAMVVLEWLSFVITTLWSNSRTLSRIVHGPRGPQ